MCDYSDAYIVVKGLVDLGVARNNSTTRKGVIFKNNAPFRSSISKINSTFTDNTEDLDIVIEMYNMLSIVTIFL